MGYNYFPTNYQPMYYANQPGVQGPAYGQQSPGNGLIWVQGEAGAKSYLVAPNTTVMLMDSENDVFYLKSSDASGMPRPLRVFDYKERVATQKAENGSPRMESTDFITRGEFNKLKETVQALIPKEKVNVDE